MVTQQKVAAWTVILVASACFLLPATIANGVTPATMIKDPEAVSSVTTSAALRARADVQIRRIKTLIVTRQADDDTAYEQLEKYQRDLRRGEK
jgi:hypothetical protein